MAKSSSQPAVVNAAHVTSTPLIGTNQASTVNLLEGQGAQVLGSAGEMRAFAKAQYDASTPAARKANAEAASVSSPLYDRSENRHKPQADDGDRALLARSVASSQVDQLMGLDVLAEERFGVDAQGNNMGVSIEVDGAQIESQWAEQPGGPKKTCTLEVNYRDPRIQKGLSDLEVLDYVTGQIDRHTGNIVVDPRTGNVKGIDNDLAFPAVDREQMLEREKILMTKAVAGLPKQVSVETAEKVLALSPDRLEQTLRNMPVPNGCDSLSDASIQGARQRLEKLQAALRDPKASGIDVVDQFNDKTYIKALAVQNEKAIASQTFSEGQTMPSFAARPDGSREMPGAPVSQDQESNMADLAQDLSRAPKTSYLGGVALLQVRNDIMSTLSPGTNGMRPPETAPNALRNVPELKKQLQSLADEKAQLMEKLSGYQERLQKLDEPSTGMKMRSLRYGGVDGAKMAFTSKESETTARLREINQQMEKLQPAAAKVGLPMPEAFTKEQKNDYHQTLNAALKEMPKLHAQVSDLNQECTNGPNHGEINGGDMDRILARADRELAEPGNAYGVANSSESSSIAFKKLATDSADNVREGNTRNDFQQVERALIAKHALPAIDREIEGIHRQMDALKYGPMDPKKLADLTQKLKDVQTDINNQQRRVDILLEPAQSVGTAIKDANEELKAEKKSLDLDGGSQEVKEGLKTKDAMKPKKSVSFGDGVADDSAPKVKFKQ